MIIAHGEGMMSRDAERIQGEDRKAGPEWGNFLLCTVCLTLPQSMKIEDGVCVWKMLRLFRTLRG
jgi:hypothetical protein